MGTVGRWPWRSASAKKRVTTYPPNRGAPKMDGADLPREAPDAVRGRRARACRGRLCASAAGGAAGADLGSSSIFRNMQRRVRPWKEVMRRLIKGSRAETRGTARWVATRTATAAGSTGGNFPVSRCRERDAANYMVLHGEKDARWSYRTASGLWGAQPGMEDNAGKGSRQNG